MWEKIERWLKVEKTQDPETRRLRITLYGIGMSMTLMAVVTLVITLAAGYATAPIVALIGLVISIILLELTRLGYLVLASVLYPVVTLIVLTVAAFLGDGLFDEVILAFPAAIAMAGLLLGRRGVIIFTFLSIVTIVGLGYAHQAQWILSFADKFQVTRVIIMAIMISLSGVLTYLVINNLVSTITLLHQNEQSLISSNQELQAVRSSLESQVDERTATLEQRSLYLQASADVGRAVSSVLDLEQLIQQVVNLIRERFELYYVGLFLVDDQGEWAVLRAGTGEAGAAMLQRGHRIKVGEGMVGWSIRHSQARIALEAGRDAVRLASDLLPNTRSEAALPLSSRGRVFGALTVQSDQAEAFDEQAITVLQSMADQVAVALDNARLFTENEESLTAMRRSYGALSQQAWSETLQARRVVGYRGDVRGAYPIIVDAEKQQDVRIDENKPGSLKLTIKARDQVLGVIEASKPADALRPQGTGGQTGGQWTEEEINLMNSLVDQLSVALENARLYENTQRRAEQERVLADITSKVRASTDVDVILRTAVQELAEALHVPRGAIRLRGHEVEAVTESPTNGGNSDE
jgi:GAF domain-containing protein